jgi:hypothetical protein
MKPLLTLAFLSVMAASAIAQKPEPFIERERAFISFRSPYSYKGRSVDNLDAVFMLRRSAIPEAKKYARRGYSQAWGVFGTHLIGSAAALIVIRNKRSSRAEITLPFAILTGSAYLVTRVLRNGKKAVRAHNAGL